ncbi:MAG: hypothetical protein IPL79_15235 [Myxococcales bacterium]|nr:hypothetical protein [Myxococcales bacterium]
MSTVRLSMPFLVAAGFAATGCNNDDANLGAAQCNPLGAAPGACIAPWPSAIYEVDDDASPTGVRLDIPADAFPATVEGSAFVPGRLNERTGFSPASQIFTVFPELVDGANLPAHDDIEASLTDDSPTVLIDLANGARVAHWAELDVNATVAGEQALYIRPAQRLRGGRTYAVAIRRSLKAKDGAPLTIPAGFAAMRDGAAISHERLARVAADAEPMFTALAAEGIEKDDLVVAWHFTTADDASIHRDMLTARDATLAAIGNGDDLAITVVDTEVDPYPGTAAIVKFDFEVPNFLDPAGGIHRDGDGAPVISGSYTARGFAVVPACSAKGPVPIILYGHGFFGLPSEITTWDAIRHYATTYCTIIVAPPWTCMTQNDLPVAVGGLSDLTRAPAFAERIIQGMMNFVALETLLRGKLTDDVLSPLLVANPDDVSFLGISQGHILGATFFSFSPTIERGVLHVGGGGWGLIFERAFYWPQYSGIIGSYYSGPLALVVAEQVLQLAFDPIDSIHALPGGVNAAIPGTVEKQILQQMSIGDSAVTNQASLYQARTAALPLLSPAVAVTTFGLDGALSSDDPTSAIVVYDEDKSPAPPETNAQHDVDNGAHTAIIRRTATQAQIFQFLSQGTVLNFCTDGKTEGPCYCALGACGDSLPED